MHLEEAQWLASYLSRQPDVALGVVLNIGSSTKDFRMKVQPFIHELVFQPLERRGICVIHADLKDEDGETVVANIQCNEDLARLCGMGVNTVICTNLLEHVADARDTARRLVSLVPPGGKIIVTVPNSYPFHPDPIDTGYRPDVEELCSLFPHCKMVIGDLVIGSTLLTHLRQNPSRAVRMLLRSVIPLPRYYGWLSTLSQWKWLFSPYRQTCVVLERV